MLVGGIEREATSKLPCTLPSLTEGQRYKKQFGYELLLLSRGFTFGV